MKLRLADGSLTEFTAAPMPSPMQPDRWLVTLPGIGNAYLSESELADRLVDE